MNAALAINPEKYVELEPVRTAEVVAQGARLWAAEHDSAPELRDVVWRLLEEAGQTLKHIRADRPAAFSTAWPDFVNLESEITAIENERNTVIREAQDKGKAPDLSLFDIGSKQRSAPTSSALSRFEEVMRWLRLIKCRSQKSRRMQLILMLAAGLPPGKAPDVFPELHFRNANAVKQARHRALNNIEEKIREACPKMVAGVFTL